MKRFIDSLMGDGKEKSTPTTWELTIITPGNVYRGKVSANEDADKRTISFLNSLKKQLAYLDDSIVPHGYIQLEDVTVTMGKVQEYYDSISIKKSDIIMAYDEFDAMGDAEERRRFESWKNPWDTVKVVIITRRRAGLSFRLTGFIIQPNQKFEGNEPFVPLTNVLIEKVIRKDRSRSTLRTRVPFVAVNKAYIEAIAKLDQKKDEQPPKPVPEDPRFRGKPVQLPTKTQVEFSTPEPDGHPIEDLPSDALEAPLEEDKITAPTPDTPVQEEQVFEAPEVEPENTLELTDPDQIVAKPDTPQTALENTQNEAEPILKPDSEIFPKRRASDRKANQPQKSDELSSAAQEQNKPRPKNEEPEDKEEPLFTLE